MPAVGELRRKLQVRRVRTVASRAGLVGARGGRWRAGRTLAPGELIVAGQPP